MSSDDFDDEDDDEIFALMSEMKSKGNPSQLPISKPYHDQSTHNTHSISQITNHSSPLSHNTDLSSAANVQETPRSALRDRLFRADGEVAILRAQLNQLQNQKYDEIKELKLALATKQKADDDQIEALKFSIEKLEDENKFLSNELKSASSVYKKRKISSTETKVTEIDQLPDTTVNPLKQITKEIYDNTGSGSAPKRIVQKVIKVQSDAYLFTDFIWNYCINGSARTSISFLDKISISKDLEVEPDFVIKANLPISKFIRDYLMLNNHLRLDELIHVFIVRLLKLTQMLLPLYFFLPTPFLLSLVHGTLSFKHLAVSKDLIIHTIRNSVELVNHFSFLLDPSESEEIKHRNLPYQYNLLDKFVLIGCSDILETSIRLSALHGNKIITKIWNDEVFSYSFLQTLLPDNTERFLKFAQINIVYNMVEILMSSITESSFAFSNERQNDNIISALLKVFLMEIPIKADFMYFGFNRILGNNHDLKKFDIMAPDFDTLLGETIITYPCPVNQETLTEEESFEISSNHLFHLLNLRIRIAILLESLITISGSTKFFNSKEYMKSIIRIIGFEQNNILKNPRSKFIYLRISIISYFVRILYYVINDAKDISTLFYSGSIYEMLVILMRIAFGSDSLSLDAQGLLKLIGPPKNYDRSIFNKWCEFRSRELHNVNYSYETKLNAGDMNSDDQCKIFSQIESDFPNGLEFPYDPETTELARELLTVCASHEEADNLYYNMHDEDPNNELDEFMEE